MKITLITCMKDEGPFIVEWIAYNRMIGVTDFLIYTNDCTDGTDELLDRLSEAGIVSRLPNPAQPGQPHQMTALKASPSHPLVKNADWVFVCDIDEFLDIYVDGGTLPDLIQACGDPMAISTTMRMMANSGVAEFSDSPVIAQFNRSHAAHKWGAERAIEVKTLTKSGFPLKFFGAHRPFVRKKYDYASAPIKWTDGSARQVSDAFIQVKMKRRRHKFPAAGASELAALNHYTLRSLDSYLVKSHRGDVNRKYREFRTKYWTERNDDSHKEYRIARRLPELRLGMQHLLELPGVKDAHATCIARHQQQIENLRKDPDYEELREELIGLSPSLQGKVF